MKPTKMWLLRTTAETVEASSLWSRARAKPSERLGAPAKPNSIEELSDAVRDVIETRESEITSETGASFAPVHARLMEAISASRELPQAAPKPWAPINTRSLQSRFGFGGVKKVALRQMAFSWGLAAMVAVMAGAGGHHLGRQSTPVLPTDKLISDFDGALKSSAPLPLVASDSNEAASWLGHKTGRRVHLPVTDKTSVHLIGARSHSLNGEPLAQTHYERKGVRLALYQIHAPEIGLNGLDEQKIGGRAFFTRSSGNYRLVAWRSGENVLAVVSPLELPEAMQVAAEMRDDPDVNSA